MTSVCDTCGSIFEDNMRNGKETGSDKVLKLLCEISHMYPADRLQGIANPQWIQAQKKSQLTLDEAAQPRPKEETATR